MIKKILILILFLSILIIAPRMYDKSSANDCFLASQSNATTTCQSYNYNQVPNNYTTYYPTTNTGTPTGNIFQQGQLVKNNNQCMYTAALSWSTQRVTQAQVTTLDPNSGDEQIFAQGITGQKQATQIQPNKNYRFTLWDISNGQKNMLSQIWVSGFGLNCAVPDNTQYYPGGTSPSGNAALTLTSNQAYCVGQTVTYTISGSSASANQTVQWTSWFNNQQNSQRSITLDSTGHFSGSGNQWTTGDVGHWKKQVSLNGASQILEFNVNNCGNVTGTNNNISVQNNSTGANTYYDPYNNNIFGIGNNNPNASGTTNTNPNIYYDPYNNNIFNAVTNSNTNGANTYYDPYGPVPCLNTACTNR
jgi:hypothetical protein